MQFYRLLVAAKKPKDIEILDLNKLVNEKRKEFERIRSKSLDYRKDEAVLKVYDELLDLMEQQSHLVEKSNAALPKWTATLATLKPPLEIITAQINAESRMLRVHYTMNDKAVLAGQTHFLVITGTKIGRMDFALRTQIAGGAAGYGAGGDEGVLTSPEGLSIPNGEAIEVFIEGQSTTDKRRVRVSNIVKLKWTCRIPMTIQLLLLAQHQVTHS